MGGEFTENLFQSVDTIVKARLANLQYDKTIECEIINDDESFDNKYLVNYQASNFIAYSNGPTYKVGDIVYVQVPQADFTQDKFIINKKFQAEDLTVVKKLPFLSFVKNENLSSPTLQNKEFFLDTTGDGEEVSKEAYTYAMIYGDRWAAGYTKLGLKIGIKASINQDLISGSYGVRVIIKGFDQSSTYLTADEAEVSILTEKTFELLMEDMITPNHYNTLGYCNQEKVFDIENFVIKTIKVELYHDGKFIRKDGTPIKGLRIYFNNLSVFLGYDISEFSTSLRKSFLYTTDGYKYDNEHYIKPIYIRFVEAINHKSDLRILTSVLEQDNYNIYWEEYNPLIKTNGPESNIISFQSLSIDDAHPSYQNILFEDGQSRLRYSFITVIKNGNDKYLSNRLDFVRDTYFNEKELIDLLTSFFRIDDNGHIYLNGGANTTEQNGLNIANVILNDIYIAQNSRIHLKDNFTIVDNNNNVLLEITNNNIKINIPVVNQEEQE